MYKNRSLKCILLIFIIIYCLGTFASVISDSDGAAFVTKQEFENLKNDFNQQIERYNNSIDSKIDGAIANYLVGIKLAQKATRKTIISAAKAWKMYNVNDYPQYVDGKPYVSGFSAQVNGTVVGTGQNIMLYLGIKHNGKSSYQTDGGFKKHIVGKPSRNQVKNGHNNYVAEWEGYYQKEGELLTLSNVGVTLGSNIWMASDQTAIRYMNVTSFSNDECPVIVGDVRYTNSAGTNWTAFKMNCLAAQRKIGEIVGDTYVSTYKTISDNRFWDSTTSNRLGITPTTPAITYTAQGNVFKAWMEDVIPTNNIDAACSNRQRLSNGYWKTYYYTGYRGDFKKSLTINTFIVQNASHVHYLLKMANDPNNLNFDRLWSAKTDPFAETLNEKYEDSETSTEDKNTIKKGLLWDSDNKPHLSMGAGYPFLEVNYDEKVELNFKIKESGNYIVYAKYGPFSPDGDAAAEANVRFKYNSGGSVLTSYALPVTGGATTKMDFYVNKEGTNYIFLKWCDTTGDNGGTMDLSEDPVVTPAEVLSDTEKATYGF